MVRSHFQSVGLALTFLSWTVMVGLSWTVMVGDGHAAEVFETRGIQSNGVGRSYHVHKSDKANRLLPLVVVLHGGGGNGKALRDTYGFKPMVEAGEMIAVYPDAGREGWLPEHVEFLDDVIDQVLQAENVDRKRLFITGASRGGLMTFVMAARSKHRFTAAGTVIASQLEMLAKEYPLKRHINFAMIAGTKDPLMPYEGGWGALRKPRNTGNPDGRVLPVEKSIELLLEANEIKGQPVVTSLGDSDTSDGCTNEVRTWFDPESQRSVMLVKVIGGGHVVPGGRQYLPPGIIGPACQDFDHAKVMWDFFQSVAKQNSHPMPKIQPSN